MMQLVHISDGFSLILLIWISVLLECLNVIIVILQYSSVALKIITKNIFIHMDSLFSTSVVK